MGLFHAAAEPVVSGFDNLKGPQREPLAGRLLVSELGCTACHRADTSWTQSMPPTRSAPLLEGTGSRLRPDWIRDYLTLPMAHGRTMPDVLHSHDDGQRIETVEALIHFLMSDHGKTPSVMPHGDAQFGRTLYQQIGCVACHQVDPAGATEERSDTFLPLPDVAAKYTLDSLSEFLRNPAARRPGGRMPSHQFDNNEASDLAAYLVGHDPANPAPPVSFTPDPIKVNTGREVFQSLGCTSCHAWKGMVSTPRAKPLAALNGEATSSCLENPGPRMPAYGLSTDYKKAIRSALAGMQQRIGKADTLDLWLSALNCLACHERGDVGGIDTSREAWFTGDETLGNDGRFPPPLTGVGAKLKGEWMEQVLAGKGRVRPYLNTRMPVFGKRHTDGLTALLIEIDQTGTPHPRPLAATGQVEAGRILAGTEGGMGCITCHGWKDRPGLTMNAVNLSTSTARLQPDWFRQYLLSPATLRPGTLMPEFWPNGVSGNPNVLNGDTEQQIASLWRFLKEGTNAPPGYPDHPAGRFVLVPESEVIVQRGFIDPAGTHAIAAGFPEGMHYVFDADACQLKAVWQGPFLDAYKLWFSRLDPTAKPAGTSVRALPDCVPFQVEGQHAAKPRFKGYTLVGPHRAPMLHYQLGPVDVTDWITPKGSSWQRRLTLSTRSEEVRIVVSPGKVEGLTISTDAADTPLRVQRGTSVTLNVEYSW